MHAKGSDAVAAKEAIVLDWSHIITAAATGAIMVVLRGIFVALVREPARALMNNFKIIKFLSGFWLSHKTYSGEWFILWTVRSHNFPRENRDRAKVYKFLRYVAAEIESSTNEGINIRYGFVGQLYGSVLTGGWFDSRDSRAGYYGLFQIVLADTMHEARGKWIGFAQDRTVKVGDLTWTKANTVRSN